VRLEDASPRHEPPFGGCTKIRHTIQILVQGPLPP
jgi:hypothetical protein